MNIERTEIADVLLLRAAPHADARGWTAETFRADALAEAGVTHGWVQDNQSHSARRGCLRGLHFQKGAAAQAKLVRVLRGAVFDVAVDLRAGSPTFGRYAARTLRAETLDQFYVPAGFAHGFITLEDATDVLYRLSAPYTPAAEAGLRWDDPDLAIAWPLAPTELSARDAALPLLRETALAKRV